MGRRQILSQSISGTSFACPHVAGAAALHAARNPFQSPAQTLARIMALARRHKITIQDVPQATTNLSLSARWL
jgi:subtilisin family serine protease